MSDDRLIFERIPNGVALPKIDFSTETNETLVTANRIACILSKRDGATSLFQTRGITVQGYEFDENDVEAMISYLKEQGFTDVTPDRRYEDTSWREGIYSY